MPRKLLKFSLNKALRTTREIASQFSLSFFVLLDVRLFSAGTSRILVHALHATRLGRTNFSHAMDFFPWLCEICEFLHAQLVSRLCALPWSPWSLRRLVVLKHSYPIVMHIQRCHWILVTFRFGLPVHRSDGASKHTFCRIHKKMDLCNYHSGQHCGWDCFQMDCLLRPSSRTFPPIICLSTFRWNLRLLDSLIL